MAPNDEVNVAPSNGVDTGSVRNRRLVLPTNTRRAFESLLESARTLSMDKATSNLLDGIDQIPALEDEIMRREGQETHHEMTRLQLLRDYDGHRDAWKATEQNLTKQIVSLQQVLEQEQKTFESMKTAETNQLQKIRSLEESVAKQRQDGDDSRKKIQGLIKAMELERQKSAVMESNLHQSQKQFSTLQTEEKELRKSYSALHKQADWGTKQLQAAAKLTVPLTDDNPRTMQRLDELWSRLSSMVCSTFFRDAKIGDSITEMFWTQMGQSAHWGRQLPLPRSNTLAAKQMRCVVILGSVARTFAAELFQPTYLLPATSGIRDMLTRQAQSSSDRESTIRALLQALSSREQEEKASERIDLVCDTVMNMVRGLILPNAQEDFRARLRSIAEEACQIWQEICRLTDAVNPSFELSNYDDWHWNRLEFQANQLVIKDSRQSLHADQNEAYYVILPRLFVSDENAHIPETHGVLFMESHARMAKEEVESVERSNSVRNRLPRVRRLSMGARSAQAGPGKDTFLGTV